MDALLAAYKTMRAFVIPQFYEVKKIKSNFK